MAHDGNEIREVLPITVDLDGLARGVLEQVKALSGEDRTEAIRLAARNLILSHEDLAPYADEILEDLVFETQAQDFERSAELTEEAAFNVHTSRAAMHASFAYGNRVQTSIDRGDSIPPPYIDTKAEVL